jgi:DNA (cytosine-5)-methyltransferase 1
MTDLLETHCCQGAAHVGYARAGLRSLGVDVASRHLARYPGRSVQADATTVIRQAGHLFRAVHTSPPCQWYTRGNAPRRGTDTRWERSIPPIREALETTGRPYVIENVKDAVWDLRDPVLLCGCMFGLTATDTDGTTLHLRRPRLFELGGWDIPDLVSQRIEVKGVEYVVRSPRACHHPRGVQVAGVYGGARRDKAEARHVRKGGYVPPDKSVAMALLGVTHPMTWEGLYECVPPAYTNWVGIHLLGAL